MSEIVSAMSKFATQIADIFVKEYSEWWITDAHGNKYTDMAVYEFLKEHTTWWGRLDPHYVSDCRAFCADLLCAAKKGPSGNWIFDFSKKAFETMGGPFRRT